MRLLLFIARKLGVIVLVTAITVALAYATLRILRREAFPDEDGLLEATWDYMWGFMTRGDLGRGTEPPFPEVTPFITSHLAADLSMFGGAAVVGMAAGIAGGVVAARRPRGPLARALDGLAVIALCAPVYWVGFMLIIMLAPGVDGIAEITLFDPGRYAPLTEDPVRWFTGLLVPWCVAGAPLAAVCLRLTRSSMAEIHGEEWIRTALGKGLRRRRVEAVHVLPVALPPTVSLTAAYTPLLVGNALLVEIVYQVPGSFRELPQIVSNDNFPFLLGTVVVGAVMVVVANGLADLALSLLDPRTRRRA